MGKKRKAIKSARKSYKKAAAVNAFVSKKERRVAKREAKQGDSGIADARYEHYRDKLEGF